MFNWDIHVRIFMKECIQRKHRIFVLSLFAYLLFLQYNFFIGVLVIFDIVQYDSYLVIQTIVDLFVEMSQIFYFDGFFFVAGFYTILFCVCSCYYHLFGDVNASLFMLEFNDNLMLYYDCIKINKKQIMRNKSHKYFRYFPMLFYHLFLLKNKQTIKFDRDKFSRNRKSLHLFSVKNRFYVAILSEVLNLVINVSFMIFLVFLCHWLYYSMGIISHKFALSLVYPPLAFIMFILIEMITVGFAELSVIFRLHLYDMNALFRKLYKTIKARIFFQTFIRYSEINRLRMFWVTHLQTNQQIEATSSGRQLFFWLYWLIPINAYLQYRFVYLPFALLYQFITFVFLACSGVGLIAPFFFLSPIVPKFNECSKRFPLIIPQLRDHICTMIKCLSFYEHVTCRRFPSGFKIWPDLIVNNETFILASFTFIFFFFFFQFH